MSAKALLSAFALASSSAQRLPAWTGPDLNPFLPLGGVSLVPNVTLSNVLRASPSVGTFNSFPIIDFHDNQFLVSWMMTNSSNRTATTGILYSQSYDGGNWTATDGKNVLFPALGDPTTKHLSPSPSLHINGSTYAAASLIPFLLYPDQSLNELLLRKIYVPGFHAFGQMFWATPYPPKGFHNISIQYNIATINEMDVDTQRDIATLANLGQLPCDSKSTTANWKCPVCLDGCPAWVYPNVSGVATIYHAPSDGSDVILYRAVDYSYILRGSSRSAPNATWSAQTATAVPDGGGEIDAGNLPDGSVYLLANSMPDLLRDPLFLTSSVDGWQFNATAALTSCSLPVYESTDQPSGCVPRYDILDKQGGAQQPQSAVLTAPGFAGLWAVYSLNSEDIWVARVPFASLV